MNLRYGTGIFIIIINLLLATILPAQTERGVGNSKILLYQQGGQLREVALYENSYALVIGMSNYKYWQHLDGPGQDIENVRSILGEHGFNVTVKMDLTGKELDQTIDTFIDEHGLSGNNRILIYFAGHGTNLTATDKRELGYIVPIDAPLPDKSEIEFKKVALSMQKIKYFAEKVQTKHALFVFDSCFSGQLFTLREGRIVPPSIGEYLDNPVRQIITSGSGNQTVPDDSKFARFFVSGLRGDADTDMDGYVTASELANYLYKRITDESGSRQTPQFGKIENANLSRGDMVFFLTKNADKTNEDETWKTAREKNSVQSLTIYINSYRNGKYFQEAWQMLEAAYRKQIASENDNAPMIEKGKRDSPARLQPFEFDTLTNFGGVDLITSKITVNSFEEDLGNTVKLKLVRIPTGKFKMGSEKTPDEKPIHEVNVPEFFIGAFEITKAQWAKVAKLPKLNVYLPVDPSREQFKDKLPVVNISWEEAEEFCARLSRFTGRRYSLPSEAEWEYAARAGTDTMFAFGSKIRGDFVNFNAGIVTNEAI